MRIVAIIQARMGSTRLPGKVLASLAGEPMLARVVARARRASRLTSVVVATTDLPADDAVAQLCAERGWPCFRGSQDDVLDRYYQAALRHQADAVVRLTADCPLIDPDVMDEVVLAFQTHHPDYAANILPPRTFPRGLDTEVFSFEALTRAWRDDHDPAWREHVTPYLYRHPELFRMHAVTADADHSGHRWTVDTPEDWELVNRIHAAFDNDDFSWRQVLDLLARHPDWCALNRLVAQKKVI